MTPLHLASWGGHAEVVKVLLSGGADGNARTNEECRPLHLAADKGHVDIVKILLQSGAQAEAKNYEGMTPLHLASWGGHAEVIKVLLDGGANGNTRTNEGMTAVHLASMDGHVSSMEALTPTCDILSVTREGKSALHLAAEYGNFGAVEWLHLQGLDPSLKDHSGQTPLQYAKDEGHKKVVEYLKRYDQQTLNRHGREIPRFGGLGNNGNADQPRDTVVIIERGEEAVAATAGGGVGAVERKGAGATTGREEATALNQNLAKKDKLLKAASDGDLKGVKMLLDEGADVEAVSSAKGEEKGLRPLHLAAWAGHTGVVRELLSRGADFKARGPNGYSTIHYAAIGGFVEVLKILHENKCNMKAKADSGQTLLHVAADNGNLKAIEWIVENTNINLEAKINDGSTALEVAQKARQKDIVNYLMKTSAQEAIRKGDLGKVRELVAGGFDANAVLQEKKNKECRPLHLAADGGHVDIVKFLLHWGAKPEAKNSEGNTVVHYAALHEDPRVLQVLHLENVDVASAVNFSGETPLHIAASRGNLKVLEWLLQKGVNVNHKNAEGMTAEEVAASKRQYGAAEILSKNVVTIDRAEGLKSLGNTCYMNTILQCLIYIKEVTALFKNDTYKQELIGPRLQANVSESFAAVVKALTYGGNYVGALKDFKSAVCGYDPLFLGNDQRDAHDFLSAFLFAARKEFRNQDASSFNELFFGKEQSVIRCVRCKKEVLQKDEIFSILTLTVQSDQREIQLKNLIASAYDEQRIKWDCNKCNSTSCARKVSIEAFPKILIIHFDRYSPNSKSIHKTPVLYPVKLTDMKNYLAKGSRSVAPNYQLRSVACHRGSMTGGHYTAICNNEDRWTRVSDERVVPVQSPLDQEAHILFYEAEAGKSLLTFWR